MALKLKDTTTLTYPTNIMKWEEEDIDPGSDEGLDISANGIKKKRRPANLCIEVVWITYPSDSTDTLD